MLSTDIIKWLPPHTMRISAKAKRITLRFTMHKGLEIVVPKKISQRKVLEFVYQNRDWIEKNQKLIIYSQQSLTLPNQLQLEFLNQIWQINYTHKNQQRFQIKMKYPNLFIVGDLTNVAACILALKKYLQRFATPYLSNFLQQLSMQYQLPFHKVTIRRQTTMWGSCSKSKAINLNYKLIFVPFDVVRYVLIHELCHTIHFDHSKKFWSLVATFIPNYQTLKRQLKEKEGKLPFWINH